MNEENIYYYALHNELNKLLVSIKQKLSDAIAGNSSAIKNAEEFKALKEDLIKVDKMSSILFASYHNISNSFYTLSSKIKDLLNELDKYIDEIEFPRVESSINSDIMKINYYDKVAQLHEAESHLLQLAYETGLSNRELVITDEHNSEKFRLVFDEVIKKMIESEIESLDIDKGRIELKYQNIITNNISVGLFGNNQEFTEQANIKERSTKIIEACNVIQKELQEEMKSTGFEFIKLQETISMIIAQNQDKIQKVDSYFTSFVLDQYSDVVKEKEQKQKNEQLKQEINAEYDDLYNELNKLKEEKQEYQHDLEILESKLENMNVNQEKDTELVNQEVSISI